MHAAMLRLQPLKTSTVVGGGSVHYIMIGDRTLRRVDVASGLWDAESILCNRGRASHSGLSRVGYFITINGPLNGHPPSILYVNVCDQVTNEMI